MALRSSSKGKVDHTYIACLECRFVGSWEVDSAMHYRAIGDDAEVKGVRLDATRFYILFRKGALVALVPSNVLTFEEEFIEELLDVNEEKQGKISH